MKKYKYSGYEAAIIVDDEGKSTYKGRYIEKYCHGYNAVGVGAGFSYSQLAKAHYINEMNKIDEQIKKEEFKKTHSEEFKNLETAEESLQYFFDMIGG